MKKSRFNTKLAWYAKTLSPTEKERNMISDIYDSINGLLWTNNCIQIWSYPRKTSITPVHDLDILYFLWPWNEWNHNPYEILSTLYQRINREYIAPNKYEFETSLQTHSVTISYKDWNEEIFWVDIVPWYIYWKNEFWEDTYKVPEIAYKKHIQRKSIYDEYKTTHKEMWWITSDPRWYIKIASELDEQTNWNLRKAVKLVKNRKNNLRQEDDSLKLKSFHLEQVITKIFQDNPDFEIFDAIFKFFVELPEIIWKTNQVQDRANKDKYIDDYLDKLTLEQKNRIIEARDWFLIKLENLEEESNIWELFEVYFYKRAWKDEEFLFDKLIPTFIDDSLTLQIDWLLRKKDWFREYTYRISRWRWMVDKNNSIKFIITNNNTGWNKYLWKVKNDNNCGQPRWEITEWSTKNNPETTAFLWKHYVECYAIIDNICVAKARQNVTLNN